MPESRSGGMISYLDAPSLTDDERARLYEYLKEYDEDELIRFVNEIAAERNQYKFEVEKQTGSR